jgi:hypothetical protein
MGSGLSVRNDTSLDLLVMFSQVTPLYWGKVKAGETMRRDLGWGRVRARVVVITGRA